RVVGTEDDHAVRFVDQPCRGAGRSARRSRARRAGTAARACWRPAGAGRSHRDTRDISASRRRAGAPPGPAAQASQDGARPGRRRRIAVGIGTIAPAAVAAQAIMLALGVKVDMLNFAAVPITIGVGADYAVNLLGAMDTLKLDARRACARMGSAILLCSMTTI